MDNSAIIAVSGSSRSGSSLMMKLLQAAGIPGLWDMFQSFEHSGMMGLPLGDYAWLDGAEGKCVKLLDITKFPPPVGRSYRVIYMTRNVHEQALSQVKFLAYMGVIPRSETANRALVRKMAASIKHDRGRDLSAWNTKYRAPVLIVSFEDLLALPRRAGVCANITDFLGLKPAVVDRMAPLIINRSAANYPGLMEIALMGRDPNA